MPSQVGNAQKFLGEYNKIEAYIKNTPQYEQAGRRIIPAVIALSRVNRVASEYQNDIIQLIELRNALVHRTTDRPIAEPYDETVESVRKLADSLLSPRTANDIATKPVAVRSTDDGLADTLKFMAEKNITNIPVLDDNGFLLGILSEASVVKWIADASGEDGTLSTAVKIAEVERFLDTPDDVGDCVYRFTGLMTDEYTVRDMFSSAMEMGKRLSAVFVTSTGKKTGEIRGIITAWDL